MYGPQLISFTRGIDLARGRKWERRIEVRYEEVFNGKTVARRRAWETENSPESH